MHTNDIHGVPSPSFDEDNPWIRRFRRNFAACTYADNKCIASFEDIHHERAVENCVEDDHCAVERTEGLVKTTKQSHCRKLFTQCSQNNACLLGKSKNTETDAFNLPIHPNNNSENTRNDYKVNNDDALGEHTDSKCKEYRLPWKLDVESMVEFTQECVIEGCDCMEQWKTQKDLLHSSINCPKQDNDNNSGNVFSMSEFTSIWKSNKNDVCSRIRTASFSSAACDCCRRNQWSPFVSKSRRHHCAVTNSWAVSINSNSSSSGDSFEVLEWSSNDGKEYRNMKINKKKLNEDYETPESSPTSPKLDLSGLDGYHTAPNSPPLEADDHCVVGTENKNTSNLAGAYHDTAKEGFFDKNVNTTRMKNLYCSDMQHLNTSDKSPCLKCTKCHRNITPSGKVCPNTNMADRNRGDNNVQKCEKGPIYEANYHGEHKKGNRVPEEKKRQEYNNYPHVNSRTMQLQTPPIITSKHLSYEGDPHTGEAIVVGKGSFGVVFKARFTDPSFYHLPIVVKEFDDEFSSTKEIFEEAQRLYYLQNTGYVPICYGMLCYNQNGQNKFGIVQELVGTGLTLEKMLWDQYELPSEFWYRIAFQCCEGLARFHEKGILLNDIKTNNILIEFGEHNVRIRYIDFGLATDMRGKRYKHTKSLEDFLYLAPEVRVNGGVTNIPSDIYSLGYMLEQIQRCSGLYEMSVVARLCLDIDPTMRLPVRGAASLLVDQMENLRMVRHNVKSKL